MSNQYDKYLKEHIQSVRKAAQWMLENLSIVNNFDASEVNEIKVNVYDHDTSKYSSEEYDAYDAYFYGEKDENAFNRAWLHHIHNNPHHWQHWLLMNDDGKYRDPDKVITLEMPKVYAIEMVADWWSFSWRSGNLEEVFDWYEKHRDNIILHLKTREFVESVLDEIRERLVDKQLCEKYYKYESKMDSLMRKLTGGLLSKSAATPNSVLYSVIEERMTNELIDENFKLECENAKLRELCLDMGICVSECEWDCSDCPRYDRCNDGVSEFIERMHELGIKVD